MKHFRDIYLIGISFIAGVLFIVQCGGSAKSIAEAVAEAIGIDYSNSESGLEAKDVQSAIDELSSSVKSVTSLVEATTPFVYDSLGKKVGVYIATDLNNYAYVWEILDLSKKMFLLIEPSTGKIIESQSELLFFTTTDCSGVPFLRLQGSVGDFSTVNTKNSAFINNKFYVYKENGLKIGEDDVQSFLYYNGACTMPQFSIDDLKKSIPSENVTLMEQTPSIFLEATEIEKPEDYTGPIFIK